MPMHGFPLAPGPLGYKRCDLTFGGDEFRLSQTDCCYAGQDY